MNATWILANFGSTSVGTVYTGVSCDGGLNGWQCVNFLQSSLINSSRLGIPVSFIGETLAAGTGGGTIFPQPVLRGCAFDVDLEARIGESIARQARIGGIDRGLSPVLQVDTDARFGRFEESYGEVRGAAVRSMEPTVMGYKTHLARTLSLRPPPPTTAASGPFPRLDARRGRGHAAAGRRCGPERVRAAWARVVRGQALNGVRLRGS